QRATVEGVADRTSQANVAEQRPPGVEDDVVDERSRVEEVLLPPRSGGRALRAGALVDRSAGPEEGRGVVEVLGEEIQASYVGEGDRLRRRDVVREDDPLGTPGPVAVVVR